MQPSELISIIRSYKIQVNNESDVQRQLDGIFANSGIEYKREFVLDKRNRIDFIIGSIGIEVKIHGISAKRIYDQLNRYCFFEKISSIILITSQACIMPDKINNKEIHVISLGRAWL